MHVCCYEQSCYKYQIRIGVSVLICRDLRARVVDKGGCSTRKYDGLRPTCQ